MRQKRMKTTFYAGLLILSIALFLPIVDQHGQAYAKSLAKGIVGTWELVSWKHKQADGRYKYPMGETPVGLLVYDKLGNISLQIMDDFRPTFENGYDQTTLQELKSVYKTYAAMFGRYTIDTSAKTIGIHVQGITNPSYLSSELTRYYDLKGDVLTMSLDKKRMNNTVWKRINK